MYLDICDLHSVRSTGAMKHLINFPALDPSAISEWSHTPAHSLRNCLIVLDSRFYERHIYCFGTEYSPILYWVRSTPYNIHRWTECILHGLQKNKVHLWLLWLRSCLFRHPTSKSSFYLAFCFSTLIRRVWFRVFVRKDSLSQPLRSDSNPVTQDYVITRDPLAEDCLHITNHTPSTLRMQVRSMQATNSDILRNP